ncbi:MAG: NAD(P)H-dependent oxidoreductase, partial [Bacteroidetes bacterium]|nr:NAD(P)H-dependent oxidoreductase [Bacteroidota bacterium]
NNFEMPIYSIDRENNSGIPALAIQFKEEIKKANGIIISFAEHNGAYSVAFKNVLDWVSRIHPNVWGDKPMFLMATSPGGNGGKSVLEIAANRVKRGNSNTITTFSLPSFGHNFSEHEGITDTELKKEFVSQLSNFKKHFNK